MYYKTKAIFVVLASFSLLSLIVVAFWFQDWQYALPTPRPARLVQPALASRPRLTRPLADALRTGQKANLSGRPLLLHFFNPNCPCSRFNLDHVRELARIYGTRVRFLAVVELPPDADAAAQIRSCRLPIPAVPDTNGAIARTYGVYSTPQAVLLDANGVLYYRGNYNVSRYCTQRSTEFARRALDSLLAVRPVRDCPPAAIVAYGCSLPSDPVSVSQSNGLPRFCRLTFGARGLGR